MAIIIRKITNLKDYQFIIPCPGENNNQNANLTIPASAVDLDLLTLTTDDNLWTLYPQLLALQRAGAIVVTGTLDTSSFDYEGVSTIQADSNPPLNDAVTLVSGTNITLAQTGHNITISATGDLSLPLTNNHIFVGQVGNVLGDVAMIGDASIVANGTLTVNSVGGSSAANIHSAELATNAATNTDTVSTIVKRDGSGNFSAGTITASLTGHASLDKAIATGHNYKFETTSSTGNLQETTVTASRAVATDANGLPIASSTTDTELGYAHGVTSSIQTQLNGKQATLTEGNLTEATSDVLSITGGTGAVIGTGTTIQVLQSNGSQDGFLSSTDWNTFNSKLSTAVTSLNANAGTHETGDLELASGTGVTVTDSSGTFTFANTGVLSVAANSGTAETGAINLVGTTNEVIITDSPAGTLTFTTPQDIDTSATPTFASETLAATTNQLVLGVTNTTTITSPAPAASRTVTLPDAGTNSSFILADGATQSINGNLTLSSTATGLVLNRLSTTQRNAITTSASGTATVVDYTQLSGATLDVDYTILTEGVDWHAATDNNTTAASIVTAITTNFPGILTASALANVVTITSVAPGADGNTIPLITSSATYLPVSGALFTGGSPVDGTLIYNTTTNQNEFFNSTAWESIASDLVNYLPLAGGTLTGNLTLSAENALILQDSDSGDAVTIEAPTDYTHSYTLKMPVAQASGTQVLQNDGSGNLSWASSGGSPGGLSGEIQYNNSSSFGGASTLTWDNTHSVLTNIGITNVVSDSWLTEGDVDTARSGNMVNASVLLQDGAHILAIAGYAGSALSTCSLYTISSGTWASTGSLSGA